mmetsp:Transcript_14883/g.21698  ORF Transcript_14883/g.21698 Transcript_14883/m.21698 type:complete len:97 (+) Transcript_14883:316-606(+)
MFECSFQRLIMTVPYASRARPATSYSPPNSRLFGVRDKCFCMVHSGLERSLDFFFLIFRTFHFLDLFSDVPHSNLKLQSDNYVSIRAHRHGDPKRP